MFIYFASPYSDPDPKIREQRYQDVVQCCEQFYRFKIPVYCPIAFWHPISTQLNLSGGIDAFWVQDKAFLDDCREMWVLNQEGTWDSLGIKRELEYCKAHRIPTRHVYFAELDQHLSLLAHNMHRYHEISCRA